MLKQHAYVNKVCSLTPSVNAALFTLSFYVQLGHVSNTGLCRREWNDVCSTLLKVPIDQRYDSFFIRWGSWWDLRGVPKNVASKRASQKKKQDGAKRGRGFAKKIPSSFGVTASVLCKHPTRMLRSTFLTFRIFRFSRGSTPPDLLLNNAPKNFKLF